MRVILLGILLSVLLSCNNNTDFYLGTWELNKEDGRSTLILSQDNRLTLHILGFKVDDFSHFNAIRISPNKYDIIAGRDENCQKFTLEKLTDDQCIGCNYKCYIDENMIDEVFIARKNQYPMESIPKPDQEIIVLPQNFEGDFFIVYQYLDEYNADEIKIDNNGIGINLGEPDFKQLFNANRIFRFEGQEQPFTIANPNGYGSHTNVDFDSLFENEKVIIIQNGFNQSGRDDWNKENNENIKDNVNIEYFTIRWIKK